MADEQQVQQEQQVDAEDPKELKRQIAALKRENAERRVKNEQYEKADRERSEAALPELERAQKERDLNATRAAQLEGELKTLKVKYAVVAAAAKLGFQNPDDAYALADLSSVEVDGEKVTGYEKSLEALAKANRLPMREAQPVAGHGTPRREQQRQQTQQTPGSSEPLVKL